MSMMLRALRSECKTLAACMCTIALRVGRGGERTTHDARGQQVLGMASACTAATARTRWEGSRSRCWTLPAPSPPGHVGGRLVHGRQIEHAACEGGSHKAGGGELKKLHQRTGAKQRLGDEAGSPVMNACCSSASFSAPLSQYCDGATVRQYCDGAARVARASHGGEDQGFPHGPHVPPRALVSSCRRSLLCFNHQASKPSGHHHQAASLCSPLAPDAQLTTSPPGPMRRLPLACSKKTAFLCAAKNSLVTSTSNTWPSHALALNFFSAR